MNLIAYNFEKVYTDGRQSRPETSHSRCKQIAGYLPEVFLIDIGILKMGEVEATAAICLQF